jgi:multidrug efflux pump subunit AcrB
MEELGAEVESRLLAEFKNSIDYTILESGQPNQAYITAHLKNKSEMRKLLKEMAVYFTNTATLRYDINPWNPSEFSIPDPPQLKIAVRGGAIQERAETARDLYQLLEGNQTFPRLSTDPSIAQSNSVVLRPYLGIWSKLKSQGVNLLPSDLADIVRTMTSGRKIGEVSIDGRKRDVTLTYASHEHFNAEEIAAIPIGINGKIIPLKALAQVKIESVVPAIYQEDQRELYVISGTGNQGYPSELEKSRMEKAKKLVAKWQSEQPPSSQSPTVAFEDAGQELSDAIQQLVYAVLMSIGLIFLILMIQFGDLIDALLVLVAIPLGLIGVLISLFVFRSTLSLNSILGVILLNGIAVANSIIIVDFLKKRVADGLAPHQAALDAARKRLRPILITSLTSILGMFPVALGLGEGGRVLQPLGISVAGGLWVSMSLTLFIVPALQVRYLEWKQARLKV